MGATRKNRLTNSELHQHNCLKKVNGLDKQQLVLFTLVDICISGGDLF